MAGVSGCTSDCLRGLYCCIVALVLLEWFVVLWWVICSGLLVLVVCVWFVSFCLALCLVGIVMCCNCLANSVGIVVL